MIRDRCGKNHAMDKWIKRHDEGISPTRAASTGDLAHSKRRHVRREPPNNRGEDQVDRGIHETSARGEPGASRRPQTQRRHTDEDEDHQDDRAVAMIRHGQRNHTENTARAEGSAEPAAQSRAHRSFLALHAPTLPHERALSDDRPILPHQGDHALIPAKEWEYGGKRV